MTSQAHQKKDNIILHVNSEISLRILKKNHVTKKYVMWLNDSTVMALTEQADATHTMETTREYVNAAYHNPCVYFFGIYFKGEHIGNIKLGPINEKHSTADIAYVIGCHKYWGQGIASKVIHATLSFGFNQLGLHKISAGAYENNIGSIKVLLKNQMKVEGTLLEEASFENTRVNVVRLGVVNTNFISKNSP